MAFKSKYSSSEVESLLDKVNGMGDTEITKEQVENVLTGNITTHRHDTTYNYTDFETDVWDGTSISTSLQGSGTKDDPYLIQSCADWLHLRSNGAQYSIYKQPNLVNATEFKPYFKVNKNLDFGNKAIPEPDASGSIEPLYLCVFDGSGAKLSNFVDSQGMGILPPALYYFAHDFIIDNLRTTADVSNGYAAIFSTQDLYSAILNCTVNASITITGNIVNPGMNEISTVVSGEYPIFMKNDFATEINEYVESNGCFCGVDINITDNTTKGDGAKLVSVIGNFYVFHPITLYCTTPLYDGDITGGAPTESFVVTMQYLGATPTAIYANNEGGNTIIMVPIDGDQTTFTATPKSLTEMKSASFVDELNSHLPKPAFRQDSDGGTPILAGGNTTIAYDGYVKQSVFDTTVEEINNSIAGNKTVVFSDVNFFQEKTTGSQQQRFFVEENFIEELGGIEKAMELFELILDQNKIIRSMIFAHVVPYIYDITSKIFFNQTKANTVLPEDGDSFYLQVGAYVAMGTSGANTIPYSFTTTVTVENFNKENMTVKIDRATKGLVSSDGVLNVLEKSQTEYDSLETKDSQTLYLITE